MNTAGVTEQTTEAFDWKLIGFIYRGRINWNFSQIIIGMGVHDKHFGLKLLSIIASSFLDRMGLLPDT